MARPEGRGGQPPLVETVGPPLTRLPWSADFAVQSLEILPVGMGPAGLFWLKPVHAPSLQVGLPKGVAPADHVVQVLSWYPLQARVVHSTSWRTCDDRVVLTYLAVVEDPERLPPASLIRLPVTRASLARGGSRSAPASIEVDAVLEHALRHLAWLIVDDGTVAAALPGWADWLADYRPEPFRPL